jgi:hypothetical protein
MNVLAKFENQDEPVTLSVGFIGIHQFISLTPIALASH